MHCICSFMFWECEILENWFCFLMSCHHGRCTYAGVNIQNFGVKDYNACICTHITLYKIRYIDSMLIYDHNDVDQNLANTVFNFNIIFRYSVSSFHLYNFDGPIISTSCFNQDLLNNVHCSDMCTNTILILSFLCLILNVSFTLPLNQYHIHA